MFRSHVMRAKQMYCEPLNSNNGWSTSKETPRNQALSRAYILSIWFPLIRPYEACQFLPPNLASVQKTHPSKTSEPLAQNALVSENYAQIRHENLNASTVDGCFLFGRSIIPNGVYLRIHVFFGKMVMTIFFYFPAVTGFRHAHSYI